MSLTKDDLNKIREIVHVTVNDIVDSAIDKQNRQEIRPIQDELIAIRNDIKEIYDRLTNLERKMIPDKQFEKLTLEQKILKLNSELLVAAKQAGVTLPR